MTVRLFILRAVVMASLVIFLPISTASVVSAETPGTKHSRPMFIPSSAKVIEPHLYRANRGFSHTVKDIRRRLKRRKIGYRLVPIYQRKQTDIARFLLPNHPLYDAVHVFRHKKVTKIFVVVKPSEPSP